MASASIWALLLGVIAALANVFGGLVLTGHDWERRYLRYFIAVGAGHLAGKDSVINMLNHDGYKVVRD